MKIILMVILAVIGIVLTVRYVERHNLYFPMKEISVTPDVAGLSYEEVFFLTSDGKRLNGWFLPRDPAPTAGKGTVLFSHGNGGNISHRIEKLLLLHELGLDVFIFDYRGYGKSQGSPSEPGFYRDAEAAYRYLRDKRSVPDEDIVFYGESLGGVVALYLAERCRARAVITESAFTSVRDMAKIVYPFIPPFLISPAFDAEASIRRNRLPVLVIHSVNDEIVPFYLGEKLYRAAGEPKRFLKIHGSHNTAFLDSRDEFVEGIRSFLDSL